jgi:hypothetical protein
MKTSAKKEVSPARPFGIFQEAFDKPGNPLDQQATTRRMTSIQIRDGKEVMIEDLLMKLSLATQTVKALADYVDTIAANDGQEIEYHAPPDAWAISGTFQNLAEVSHALKCACWGHSMAFLH